MKAMILKRLCTFKENQAVLEMADHPDSVPTDDEIQEFPLEMANQALVELKTRKIRGAKVLRID